MCPVQCKAIISVVEGKDMEIYKPKKCILFANKPDWRPCPTAVCSKETDTDISGLQEINRGTSV